jgi:predicted N-acetyltransferase YhbS
MSEFTIRDETSSDHAHVEVVQAAAFGRPDEAALVAALRISARPQLSLVAELGGEIVGHVFFSPVRIEGAGEPPPAAGLAALRGLHYESEFFDSAFQCIELSNGALSGCTGYVRYAEAFAEL